MELIMINAKYNIGILNTVPRGAQLMVSRGKLRVATILERAKSFFSKTYREKACSEVRQIVDQLALSVQIDDRKELTHFFKETFSSLSENYYSRVMNRKSYDILLNPCDSDTTYEAAVKAASVWSMLGNYRKGDGCSGSYQIFQGRVVNLTTKLSNKSEVGKVIGIFKPWDEETFVSSNPNKLQKLKYWLSRTFLAPISGSLHKMVGGQAYVAEAAATVIAKHLEDAVQSVISSKPHLVTNEVRAMLKEIDLVPETQIVNLLDRKGSFQLWVQAEKVEELSSYLGLNENYKGKSFFAKIPSREEMEARLPKEFMDLLALFDVISGNGDRHGANALIRKDRDGEFVGMSLIDGGQAMAPSHPRSLDILPLQKMYFWRRLPLSENRLTLFGKEVVKEMERRMDGLKNDLSCLYQPHLKDSTARIDRLGERFEVFAKMKDRTIYEIANVRTGAQIEAILES